MLAGGVCGIFDFGGIGAATARLMHGIGMRVHAINRHGRTDEQVDWIGTPERLNDLLEAADVIASPHNSGQGGDAHDVALRRAVENCRRALTGEVPLHVIGLDERLM
jgi:phosphoglycerate dehydrogenase-like enzyme